MSHKEFQARLVVENEFLRDVNRPKERVIAWIGAGYACHFIDPVMPDGISSDPDRLADRMHNIVEDLRRRSESTICDYWTATKPFDPVTILLHHGSYIGNFDNTHSVNSINKLSLEAAYSAIAKFASKWVIFGETDFHYPSARLLRKGISRWAPDDPLGILPFRTEKEIEWVKEETIPSRILEINDNTVILECLMDAENHLFENRVFEKKLLEGVVDLEQDGLVLIEVMSRKGEIRFLFKEGENFINPDIFAEPDYASQLENWND
jgi:hypothetical protein